MERRASNNPLPAVPGILVRGGFAGMIPSRQEVGEVAAVRPAVAAEDAEQLPPVHRYDGNRSLDK